MKKIDISEVQDFVKNNSQCELLSSEYHGSHSKLLLKCKCGDVFSVSFSNFKNNNKRQCNKCGKKINDSKQRRNSLDDIKEYVQKYSNCTLISSDYINAKTKLKFQCECGNVFETTWINFKNNNKKQCNECGHIQNIKNNSYDLQQVKSIIENNSNCILLSKKYINNRQKLQLRCTCGNVFETNLETFIGYNKKQCNECSKKVSIGKMRLSVKEAQKHIEENSECKLLSVRYLKIGTRNVVHFELRCGCGEVFVTSKNSFDNYDKKRCEKCSGSQSRYEYKTETVLKKLNIDFEKEKRFEKCKYKQTLSFDFYLPIYNTCIEIDGEFHFKETSLGNDFENQVKRDKIKDIFCKENNINLIRIPYWEIDNIEELIIKYLNDFE